MLNLKNALEEMKKMKREKATQEIVDASFPKMEEMLIKALGMENDKEGREYAAKAASIFAAVANGKGNIPKALYVVTTGYDMQVFDVFDDVHQALIAAACFCVPAESASGRKLEHALPAVQVHVVFEGTDLKSLFSYNKMGMLSCSFKDTADMLFISDVSGNPQTPVMPFRKIDDRMSVVATQSKTTKQPKDKIDAMKITLLTGFVMFYASTEALGEKLALNALLNMADMMGAERAPLRDVPGYAELREGIIHNRKIAAGIYDAMHKKSASK